jgi:hypothetical protein
MSNNLTTAHQSYLAVSSPERRNALMVEVANYAYVVCIRRKVYPEDAKDTAHDAAITIMGKLKQFDPALSSFKTWTHRCTLDQISINRRKAVAHRKDVDEFETAPAPHRATRPNKRIEEARRVAGDNVALIDLVIGHGDIAAAARQLGMTPAAAKNRLKRLGRKINLAERQKPSSILP